MYYIELYRERPVICDLIYLLCLTVSNKLVYRMCLHDVQRDTFIVCVLPTLLRTKKWKVCQQNVESGKI